MLLTITPLRSSFDFNILNAESRNTVKGMRQAIPRHTCHNVVECLDVAADDTIRNTRTAKSPPEESERFIMRL